MASSRREFLAVASAAAAASAAGPLGAAVSAAAPAWRPPSDEERLRLVALAQFGPKQPARGRGGMAVSTHPLASQAAVDMLRLGGNAIDGVCAASLVQTVVEPHMTTITGTWSVLHFEAGKGAATHLNCTGNAPLDLSGLTIDTANEATLSGKGVVTPGFWMGIETAMKRWGALPLKQVMAPAIHYARHGFEVHSYLYGYAFQQANSIAKTPQGREVYFPGGVFISPGRKMYQKRYADLLERLSEEGSRYFYQGAFAENFSRIVREDGGTLTPADFRAYKPLWSEPTRGRYRGHELLAGAHPDFGGNCLAEIMNVLDLVDLKSMGPAFESPETGLIIFRAINEVYTDAIRRNFGYTRQTHAEAGSRATAERRLAKIRTDDPLVVYTEAVKRPVPPGTNQLTVVDRFGNIASALHSVMSNPWSNGLFIEGTSICSSSGHFLSGMPKPGGRLFNRLGCNILLKDGRPVLASGSPSFSLLENIVQNSTNIVDFGMSIEDSVRRPRLGNLSGGRFMAERDLGETYLAALERGGVPISVVPAWHWGVGSFDGIAFDAAGVAHGCGDPRRTAAAFAA